MSYDSILKSISVFIAVCGLLFGLFQFIEIQRIEAARPYLQKKLEWCETAVETASSVAIAKAGSEERVQRFWELYWGVMGLIEKEKIKKAMDIFGDALEANDTGSLKRKALLIAHACRTELANDWSPHWGL